LYASHVSPIRATCPAHLSLFDLITQIIFCEEYLLGPNILFSILFSSTLSLHSSLSVSDQVLPPYKTTGEIIVLRILFLHF
jgi:hypothetical protein